MSKEPNEARESRENGPQKLEEVHVNGSEGEATTRVESPPETPEDSPEGDELGLLREEHDKQAQELADVRSSLEQMQRERDIYRQLSGIAESNELKLHRKLSEYTDQEMAALRRRCEELERRMGEDAVHASN